MTREHLRTLVSSILEQYKKLYGIRDLPISVDKLRPMLEERGWVDRILWDEFEFESKHILAQVEFFRASMGLYAGTGDYAIVQYSIGLNFCWQRFAICKEMFHAVIDAAPETRVTTIEGLLKLAEMLVSETTASIAPFSPFMTEQTAVVLAVETLFPLEYRLRYEDRYRAGEITDLQLAERFRIPEDYIRRAMYPAYMRAVEDARNGTLVSLDD